MKMVKYLYHGGIYIFKETIKGLNHFFYVCISDESRDVIYSSVELKTLVENGEYFVDGVRTTCNKIENTWEGVAVCGGPQVSQKW